MQREIFPSSLINVFVLLLLLMHPMLDRCLAGNRRVVTKWEQFLSYLVLPSRVVLPMNIQGGFFFLSPMCCFTRVCNHQPNLCAIHITTHPRMIQNPLLTSTNRYYLLQKLSKLYFLYIINILTSCHIYFFAISHWLSPFTCF